MSDLITQPPWLPPYFGPWDQFINWLLHNPTGGSGHGHPHSVMAMERLGPRPEPWAALEPSPSPWRAGVGLLLQALAAQQVAAHMPQGDARIALEQQTEQAINEAVDGYCGTPWHWPWPWPGPPPWWQEVVSLLSVVASTLPEGQFRGQVLQAAGRMTQNALSGAAPRVAPGTR